MAKGTFTVVLADGTQLSGLGLNGNNFISEQALSEADFAGKLSKVTITGDAEADEAGLIGTHEHMELVQVKQYGSEYWFVLREIGAAELERIQNRADIEYIAMMAGIEL